MIQLPFNAPPAGWYAELKGWQSGLGSLLGLFGLVLGALFNARINRKRDDRLRHQEAMAVAAAIYSEMLHLRFQLARMANGVGKRFIDNGTGKVSTDDPFNRHFMSLYPLPAPTLYLKVADKVGLLPADVARRIVSFYVQYELAKGWMPQLREDPERGYSLGVGFVLDPAMEALKEVEPALRAIEAMIALPQSAKEADVEQAKSALEIEELMSQG